MPISDSASDLTPAVADATWATNRERQQRLHNLSKTQDRLGDLFRLVHCYNQSLATPSPLLTFIENDLLDRIGELNLVLWEVGNV